MAANKALISLAALLVLTAGCSFSENSLLPSLSGDKPSGEKVKIAASQDEQAAGEATDVTAPAGETAPVAPVSASEIARQNDNFSAEFGSPTGTFVGRKVLEQRTELENLQTSIRARQVGFDQLRTTARQNSQAYFATVAAVTARLRIGTTPGNPVLVSQWNAAQSELDRMLTDIAALNTLGNQVAADSAMANYLLEAVRATYGLQGAVDEDHRQLALIEDETNRSVVLIDRVLGEVQETIVRYTNYVNAERRNLSSLALAIKDGEYVGQSLANQTSYGGDYAVRAPRLSSAEPIGNRRPLVVIRFDRDDVEFKQALYQAVSAALERRPESAFDLVAVAPNQGSPAQVALGANASKHNAEKVMQALTEMGLPAGRVIISSTTSPSAQTNEVHLYLR